jgi:Uma2 family endonuclease
MVSVRQHRTFTLDEYLRIERDSVGQRSEFLDGHIWAMVGGSLTHSKIITNLVGVLFVLLRGKPCQAYNGDLRLLIKDRNMVTYPDAMVICGPPECHRDGPRDTVLNPSVVFEVLSPSTGSFDRGDKLDAYRTIPTVKHVVLVSQEPCQVELHTRAGPDAWTSTVLRGAETMLELPAVDVRFVLNDLYQQLP